MYQSYHVYYTIIIFNVLYLFGVIISSFIQVDNTKNQFVFEIMFKRFIYSLIVSIVCYSLYITSFFSINMVLLFMLIYYLIYFRKDIKFQVKKIYFNELIIANCLLVFVMLIIFAEHFVIYNKTLLTFDADSQVYASIVSRLNTYKIESLYNVAFLDKKVTVFYHYGDLWFSAMLSRLSSILPIYIILVIAPSVLATVFVIGTIAILQRIMNNSKLNIIQIILALSILVISGISFYIPKSIQFFNTWWLEDFNPLLRPKYLIVGIMLYAACLDSIRKRYMYLPLYFIASVVFNPVSLLPILCTFIIYVLFLKYKEKEQIKPLVIPFLLSIFVLTIYIYIVAKNNQAILVNNKTFGLSPSFIYVVLNKTLHNFIDVAVRNAISIFFPSLAILYYIVNKKDFNLIPFLFLLLLLTFFSVLSLAILNQFNAEAVQSWTIIGIFITPLLVLVSILLLYFSNKKVLYLYVPLLILSTVINLKKNGTFNRKIYTFNDKFINNISSELNNNKNLSIAFFEGKRDSTQIWANDRNIYIPLNIVLFKNLNYNPVCLSVYDIEYCTNEKYNNILFVSLQNAPFYKFVQKEKDNNTFRSIDESQLNFIEKYNVKYLIISNKSKISPVLLSQIKDCQVDDISGYKFCTIK